MAMPRFRDLIAEERRLLGSSGDEHDVAVSPPNAAGEPRVAGVGADVCGLALSGGGIRSATFNLGVLQALAQLDLLKHFDYMATVSGGGYIGGWWTAWRLRAPPDALFPRDDEAEYELRHLREYSKYLAPRWSVADLDSWLFVAAIFAMMLPSFLATFAFAATAFLVFCLVAELLVFAPYPIARVVGAGVLTYVVLVVSDRLWRRRTCPELGATGAGAYHLMALIAGATVLGFAFVFDGDRASEHVLFLRFDRAAESQQPFLSADFGAALAMLLRPTWCWLAAYGTMAMLRHLLTRAGSSISSVTLRGKVDRVLARLVALAVGWTLLALLWEGGIWLSTYPMFAVATEPLLFGLVFVVLWAWRASKAPPNIPHTPTLWQDVRASLPLVLAYVTLIVGLLGTVSLLVRAQRDLEWPLTVLLAVSLGGVALTILLFDPAESGLHSAFRARMARAYLGSWPTATESGLAPNRAAEPQARDDFPVARLRQVGRPLHLVCCAANDLSGDPLSNLNRGARSATVSALGLAVGDSYVPWIRKSPTFGSLLTASAATFNPNMGSASMRTGPVVRVLATALNLRLGLWLPVDRSRLGNWVERWLPGRLLYAELLGLTRADLKREVHLSDGSHFDNTGIYELVRRRCRFIVLSDCGEDPAIAFDDIGNAIRKLRQDFGIDVRIDLDSLRADERGLSRQHVAVGEIEYAPHEIGTLIVLKPTLTGDEPIDVQQYKTRNAHFPHESTGNQFYDAAQWESYRRLGYHATLSAFATVTTLGGDCNAARVFAAMREQWYPAPSDLTANLLLLTQRFSAFEDRVRLGSPRYFRLELYPELREIARGDDHRANRQPTLDEQQQVLTLLLQFTQLMEDVWLGCQLDSLWNHPLNSGWMNYFHRWTSTPSFKMWWPILRPVFSQGLRRFAKERLDLPSPSDDLSAGDSTQPLGEVAPLADGFGERLASRAWLEAGLPAPNGDQRVYQYLLHLRRNATDAYALQAGLVAVTITAEDGARVASWDARHLFTAPSLRGAGLERVFLHGLLRLLQGEGVSMFRVDLPDGVASDPASARQQQDLVDFYTRAGYVRSPRNDNRMVMRPASLGGHREAPASAHR